MAGVGRLAPGDFLRRAGTDDLAAAASAFGSQVDKVDVIKTADHLIDLGPEGGDGGGQIVATGTPEEIAANPLSFTGQYLKKMLDEA